MNLPTNLGAGESSKSQGSYTLRKEAKDWLRPHAVDERNPPLRCTKLCK